MKNMRGSPMLKLLPRWIEANLWGSVPVAENAVLARAITSPINWRVVLDKNFPYKETCVRNSMSNTNCTTTVWWCIHQVLIQQKNEKITEGKTWTSCKPKFWSSWWKGRIVDGLLAVGQWHLDFLDPAQWHPRILGRLTAKWQRSQQAASATDVPLCPFQ